MSTFDIKIIAVILMLIDHAGAFFFPSLLLPRLLGRLSFFLFAWLIANGAHYTHHTGKYLFRLFIFALISQIPFNLAVGQISPGAQMLNVFFTLFLGLVGIKLITTTKNKFYWALFSFICAGLAEIIRAEYGAVGVFTILLFYIFYKDITKMVLAQFILYLIFLISLTIPLFSFGSANFLDALRPIGLLSLVIIARYNHKPGPKIKYFFYLFYPLQYLVIHFLRLLIK